MVAVSFHSAVIFVPRGKNGMDDREEREPDGSPHARGNRRSALQETVAFCQNATRLSALD
jgi:hypothetical protein